ncbi:MAG: hypothetical protein ACRD1Y_07590 [Terriglobales bacterium]
MPAPVEPDAARSRPVVERTFALPLAAPRTPPAAEARGLLLRISVFAVLLGAVMTILYAWFLIPVSSLPTMGPALGLASFERVLVPILAITAVIGVLIIERAAVFGVVLLLVGTALGLSGGSIWLVPGAVLACVWAGKNRAMARTALGFLLLVPGVAICYIGLLAGIDFLSQLPARGLPSSIWYASPQSLGQALLPLEFLPLALLGAWLLVRPPRAPSQP